MPAVLKTPSLLRAPAEALAPVVDAGKMAVFARLAERTGAPVTRLLADFAALAVGPGRIGLSDYERLRLYDQRFWGGADRREVVGARRSAELALKANFRLDWLGFASNRLAWGGYLAAHGLPVAPVLAIYRNGLATPAANLLRTRDELRRFLGDHCDGPLLASVVDGEHWRVLFRPGSPASAAAEIDRFIEDAADAPAVGWLFQLLFDQHPAIAVPAADPRATIRLITLNDTDGPRVWRACWTLPVTNHIVAALDLRSGRAQRIAPAHDPALGRRAPPGLVAPDWPQIKATAVEGARLLSEFGLLGWDIAPTASGPLILGLTATPEFAASQLLVRRGLLTEEFQAFLAERRRLRADLASPDARGDG